MRRVSTVQAIEHERTQWTGQVGFVPTMGYLHEGHLSLVRRARAENQVLVVSIFVNPAQFGLHEDMSRYPRDVERDLYMLDAAGVDVVFMPTPEEMYPPGFSSSVDVRGPFTNQAEGAFRPSHFAGVCTIVLKLFQLVQPDLAYFGQKDAQQVAVITRMVTDFNLSVKLSIVATVREADGLAMSSRNSYLDPTARAAATVLYRGLQAGRSAFAEHAQDPQADPHTVVRAMIDAIAEEPLVCLDYAEVRDVQSFLPLEKLQAPALLVMAVRIGSVRLIDNFLLNADGTWNIGILISDRA